MEVEFEHFREWYPFQSRVMFVNHASSNAAWDYQQIKIDKLKAEIAELKEAKGSEMNAHTPAPWRIESDPMHYDTLSTVTAGEKRKNKKIDQMWVQVGGYAKPKEQEANARLIAAAPELLAGAESARAALRDVCDTRDSAFGIVYAEALRLLDESINKAIGA